MKNWIFPFWVIIDFLVLISCIVLWIAAPEFKTLNIALTLFGGSLGFLLLVFKFDAIKIYVTSKHFEKVLFHSINIVLVISILSLLNYLGNQNFKDFDLTKQKRNSLTEQTKKVLEMVHHPLKMTLYAKREEWAPMLNLLKLFEGQNKLVEIDAVDTDVRLDLVKSKGITQNGSVSVSYQGSESLFVLRDELSVTNALLKALRDEKIVLYFIKGHQELSCGDNSQEGISFLCEKLKAQNYEIKELDLTQVSSVPKDATAVFVLGPISGFLNQEVHILKDFLNDGGSFFLALAPAFKSEVYDNLVNLVREYGLNLGRDLVIDRLSTVQGAEATIPIVSSYEQNHPITQNFNLRTVFPLSSSVSLIQGKDMAQLLARTSSFPGSWAETNLQAATKGKAEYKEGEDIKGPIGLLGISEGIGKQGNPSPRVTLLGSSSFLINAYQTQSGNSTLFLNTVSWLVNDEGIISLNRPGIEEYPVIFSSQHLQLIFIIAVIIVPIIFFGTAIFIYRRRRYL